MGILFSSDTTEVKDQVLDNLKDIKMWCLKLPEKSQTDLKLTHYFLHFITFQFITVTITQKTQYPPDHPQQAGSRQIGPRQLGPTVWVPTIRGPTLRGPTNRGTGVLISLNKFYTACQTMGGRVNVVSPTWIWVVVAYSNHWAL